MVNISISIPFASSVNKFFFEPETDKNLATGSSKYLSLGETTWDWFRQIQPLADRLYRDSINDIADYFASAKHPADTPAKAEMLVGHLAKALSGKFARSLAQARVASSMPGGFVASELTSEEFVIPRSTIEAIRLVHSREFQRVVDHLSACHELGQSSPLELVFVPEDQPGGEPQALMKLYFKAQWLLQSLCRLSSFTLVSTYLGRFQETMLCAMFGRPPIFVDDFPLAFRSRRGISTVRLEGDNGIRALILNLLKAICPPSLVEDFDSTIQVSRRLGYPDSPKLIFTSNSFYASDAFKCHLVSCAERVKYVVGQHGAGYGTSMIREGSPEINSADAFFSWGVVPEKSKFVAVGQLRPRIRAKLPKEIKSLTLILRKDSGSYLTEYSDRRLNEFYTLRIAEFCRFLNNLGIPVELKPHAATSALALEKLSSAIKNLSNVRLLDGQASLNQLTKRGSLVIFTYDSTGILELASANIPFFFYAVDGIDLLLPEIRGKYAALEKAGLMSTSNEQASQMIPQLLSRHQSGDRLMTSAISNFANALVSKKRFPLLTLFVELRKVLKHEAN